jgi:predicted TIM-barrel fold metal-dependent hydrolase
MESGEKLAEEQTRKRWQDHFIIDADVHVHDAPDALARYCATPWKRALEHLTTVPDRYLDLPGLSPRAEYMAPFPGGYEKRSVESSSQLRTELTELAVDIGVMLPDNLLRLALLPQAEYASALARAYNEWVVSEWADPSQGLLTCIAASPQAPSDAAAEIERYAGNPAVVGVYLPAAGVDPLWGHRMYDPIYAAAEAANLPVLLHGAVAVHPVFPCQLQGYDTYLARHTLGHTLGMIANLVSIVTTGVPVRFPNLRIAFAEAGLGWVPFIMMRLDKEYTLRRRDVPFLVDRPSTYVRRMYFVTQPVEEPEDTRKVEDIIRLFEGEDNVMFASDWPHPDFDHPQTIAKMIRSEELRGKIFGANARVFFNLDDAGHRVV